VSVEHQKILPHASQFALNLNTAKSFDLIIPSAVLTRDQLALSAWWPGADMTIGAPDFRFWGASGGSQGRSVLPVL